MKHRRTWTLLAGRTRRLLMAALLLILMLIVAMLLAIGTVAAAQDRPVFNRAQQIAPVVTIPPPLFDIAIASITPRYTVVAESFELVVAITNRGNQMVDFSQGRCEIRIGTTIFQEGSFELRNFAPGRWEHIRLGPWVLERADNYEASCSVTTAIDHKPANNELVQPLYNVSGRADVWTKDNEHDNGDVPTHPYWYSPDLWVRRQDDGVPFHQNPVAHRVNWVYVRVRNRGDVPILNGSVDVYWHEPALAVLCTGWAYIGTVYFRDLAPGQVQTLKLPWTPTRTGHSCLLDVVDSPQDPYNRALVCSPLRVPWDNNVEQRNLEIIYNYSPFGRADGRTVHQTQVNLLNVYSQFEEVDIVIERKSYPQSATLVIEMPAYLFDRWQDYPGAWSEGVEVDPETHAIRLTGAVSGTIGAIPLAAYEQAILQLNFDSPAGENYEIDIQEHIDGDIVGGVAYRWFVPFEQRLPVIFHHASR